MEGASGSLQGSGDFCAPWQKLKPRNQPLQLLGSLPWVTYSPSPHVCLTLNCSSPIRVLRRWFISSALERSLLFLIKLLGIAKVSSPSSPLDSFIMEIFFTLGSLLCVFVWHLQ